MSVEDRPRPDPRSLVAAGATAEHLHKALGRKLVAVYLHGSAVLGGFDPETSDLDLLVVCLDSLSDAEIDAICNGIPQAALPARGLEMSVLTRTEALHPDRHQPRFQLHVAVGADGAMRCVDGRMSAGDRDLILHVAVSRAAGYAMFGPPPGRTLAAVSATAVRQAAIDEIDWARTAGTPVYLVLAAARARVLVRAGRLVSKVEAVELAAREDENLPILRAALAAQRGDLATVDPVRARDYADKVEAELRRDLRLRR